MKRTVPTRNPPADSRVEIFINGRDGLHPATGSPFLAGFGTYALAVQDISSSGLQRN
jgi:hypothetical protein